MYQIVACHLLRVALSSNKGHGVCELAHFFFYYWFILFAGWRFIPDLHDRLCGDVPVPGRDRATHRRGHCDRFRSTSGEYLPHWSTKWHRSSVYYYIVVVSVVIQTSPLPAFFFYYSAQFSTQIHKRVPWYELKPLN